MKMDLKKISQWLLVIGGLNWGLSIFGINLVDMLAGATADIVGTIVYGAVGIAAILVGKDMLKM